MPYLQQEDLQIYYETAGDPSAPPLLIITGLTDYTAKARWQSADLAADHYIITYDNRGAGRSSSPPPGYTTADMAGDAAAVLEALAIESTNVFGFSLGGMVAQQFTLRWPAKVRRLVLGCTSAGGPLRIPPQERALAVLLNPTISGDPRQDYLDGVDISVGRRTLEERPDLLEKLADLAEVNPQTSEAYAGQFQAAMVHDLSERLGEIVVPTLVLHGEEDQIMPLQNGRLLAERIPDARLVTYPEAGHLFFIEHAAAVNDEIRSFLATDA